MSNDTSTYPPALAPAPDAEAPAATQSLFSVDRYADRLMDELFEDVEGLLGPEPEAAIAAPQPPAPVTQDLAVVPPQVDDTDLDLAPPEPEPYELTEPLVDDTVPPEPAQRTWLDALMMATTGISIVVLTVVGVAYYVQSRAIAPTSSTTNPVSTATPENQEFATYMQRSLNAINRRAGDSDSSTVAIAPDDQLPSVPVAGSPAGAGQQAGVLERVYIPVYQPPQTAAAPAPTTAPTTAPTQAPTTTPAPSSDAAPRLSSEEASPTAARVVHTLVGVLELGDRSAALFDIAGNTQRVYVGESIGSSGWTLVSITNQEAIVRRNGDVRSIYVGQQF
ncbi:hypothetical protein [Leptolyngbya sp. CCY15150]|uniref:hypothetical protein n=1 Tax=Leptolyngbya sp. CCY15150 TaxID=2767772 RepID=UPI00194E4D68|nr:hypothetical protein [Leptolyngbya sp. CCY15150]